MTKTDRTIILVGAGAIVAMWLLRRIAGQVVAPVANETGLPPIVQQALPISNALSTCDCPAAKSTNYPIADYSQGGFTQAIGLGAPAVPPSIGGALNR